jgi:hypothetical protein
MENTGHGAVKMDSFSSKAACVTAAGFFGWVFGWQIIAHGTKSNAVGHVFSAPDSFTGTGSTSGWIRGVWVRGGGTGASRPGAVAPRLARTPAEAPGRSARVGLLGLQPNNNHGLRHNTGKTHPPNPTSHMPCSTPSLTNLLHPLHVVGSQPTFYPPQ